MDSDERENQDEAMRALAAGYAVLDEAEINPEFAALLRRVFDLQLHDDFERKLLGLPALAARQAFWLGT